MRVLHVDGTNLFCINYAANPAANENGIPIGGIVGTLKSLRNIIKRLKPDRVIFIWDGPGGSSRKRKLFGEYKKGRRPKNIAGRYFAFEDEEQAKKNRIWQIKILESILDYLPICQIVTNNSESDDVIAYIVNGDEYFGHRSNIIVSTDKDFYQLVSSNTVIYNPISKKIIHTESILTDYKIHPNNWILFKAINGDKSDNIDGVKGFGPKTILKLFEMHKPDQITLEYLKSLEFEEFESEKIINKKYTKLRELTQNMQLLERNWELMYLKNPLISLFEKDTITDKIINFKPAFNKAKFYVEIMKLGSTSISPIICNDFSYLRFK